MPAETVSTKAGSAPAVPTEAGSAPAGPTESRPTEAGSARKSATKHFVLLQITATGRPARRQCAYLVT
jgi:hypothetical protein